MQTKINALTARRKYSLNRSVELDCVIEVRTVSDVLYSIPIISLKRTP